MRLLILLLFGICTLTVHAETRDPCANGDRPEHCEATNAVVQESPGNPAGDGTETIATSPWQGTWTGSENNSFGGKVQVRVKIKVTNGTISGSWNVHAGGLKPITGTVKGEEASITILQGGGMINATLVNEKTFKYSGIRGYGTLTKQEAAE